MDGVYAPSMFLPGQTEGRTKCALVCPSIPAGSDILCGCVAGGRVGVWSRLACWVLACVVAASCEAGSSLAVLAMISQHTCSVCVPLVELTLGCCKTAPVLSQGSGRRFRPLGKGRLLAVFVLLQQRVTLTRSG